MPSAMHEESVRLGAGRALSRRSLAGLREAVTAAGPVGDSVRYRLAMAVCACLLLIWLGIVGGTRAARAFGTGDRAGGAVATGLPAVDGDAAPKPDTAVRGLRNDLFGIPVARTAKQQRKPRTNPVELLELMELQGVMGGSLPRAIILYKRSQETVTVSAGDDLGEFQVTEIRERSVVLTWRDEQFELSL